MDLGIVPNRTSNINRVMARKNALNALGEKERNLVLSLGRKKVVVYDIVSGIGRGMGVVQCSMYPNLAGIFPSLEKAIERAHRIKSFHERQLDIMFVEQEKEE